MKRRTLIASLFAAAAIPLVAAPAWSQPYGMGPGMMGGYGPGYGMGPGMMGGYGPGYGMGPGMMGSYGPGYGMGPGMMGGYGPGYGMGPGMMGGYGPGYGMGPGMMGGCGPGGYGYGIPDLTNEQRAKIGAIQDESARKQWALMGSMQELMWNREVYSDGKFDENAARKAFDAMTGLRKQMFENSLEARKRIDSVLTPQQRKQLSGR